jgi:hypothetical protein
MRSPEKKLGQRGKSVLQQRFIAPDPGREESFDDVKIWLPDPAKQAKL